MSIAYILDTAAEILTPPGVWASSSTEVMRGGRHCAWTAMCAVNGGNAAAEAAQYLCVSLGLPSKWSASEVIGWNDRQRDRRKVIRALRRAAREARQHEAELVAT